MRTPTLASRPSMDELPAGPEGETFGQLKQAVRDARAALVRDSCDETVQGLLAAISALKDAYARVGLPYRAPL